MYEIVTRIIDHVWQSNYSGDQQYIVLTCGALITVWSVAFIDAIKSLWRSFTPGRKE